MDSSLLEIIAQRFIKEATEILIVQKDLTSHKHYSKTPSHPFIRYPPGDNPKPKRFAGMNLYRF